MHTNVIKIVLATLSLLCLADMPYGYYQLYRFIAMVAFAYLAYKEQDNTGWMVVWIASALLVQPFFKIALGREMWGVMDVVWAGILLYSVIKKRR